jgi:hypothetical protein
VILETEASEKTPPAVEEDVESVFEALRLKREEWAATAPISDAFKTIVLGGRGWNLPRVLPTMPLKRRLPLGHLLNGAICTGC